MATEESARRRQVNRAAFFIAVIAVLTVVQTPLVSLLLSNLVALPEADRLAETLRSTTPGVLVALAVTYFYERSKDTAYQRGENALAERLTATVREALAEEDAGRLERQLASRPPEDVLGSALNRVFGAGSPTRSLSANLVPRRRILRNVTVELTLRDSRDSPGEYIIESAQSAMVHNLPEITLACVIDPQVAFRISAACPEFSYIWSCESAVGLQQAVHQATSDSEWVHYRVKDDAGQWSSTRYGPFEPIPPDEYADYGVTADLTRLESVILLRKPVPEGVNRMVDYTVRSTSLFPRTARFAYHTEDHLSHVDSIKVNWRDFTIPPGGLAQPALIPFFPLAGPLPDIEDRTRVEIKIDQWLLPGAGVMLTW